MSDVKQSGSASIEQSGYWWYRARSGLLEAGLGEHLGCPSRLLDIGSADGPSVGWVKAERAFSVDVDPRGLRPGTGVCASALSLPFRDQAFDVVTAFDVLEHCEPEHQATAELARVLQPGGRLLMSVPAYQWAWTDHDVRAGHHRRYTRRRLLAAVEGAGFVVERCSYSFTFVFPFFAAERVMRRLRPPSDEAAAQRLPSVSEPVERVLMNLSEAERRVLRRRDLPFGSSIFLAARKPGRSGDHRQTST